MYGIGDERCSFDLFSPFVSHQADIELRTTIIKCWPHTKRDKIDLLVPTQKRERI